MPLSLVLALVLAATPSPSPEPAASSDAPIETRALHTALAVAPGIFVWGLGHSLNGDAKTASKLRWISGGSLAAVVIGGAALIGSGGSDRVPVLYVPLIFGGVTGLVSSWLADVAGTARPQGWAPPLDSGTTLAAALQYGGSWDPYTRIRHLGLMTIRAEGGHWLADGWAGLAPGNLYGEAHVRAGGKLLTDGGRSHLALVAELELRRSGTADDLARGAALVAEGRLDGAVLSPSLRGLTFVERLGIGVLQTAYGTTEADSETLLIVESGISWAVSERVELGLLHVLRPDSRLGWVASHAGALELQARYAVAPPLRLVATGHVAVGFDALAGVEAAW